MWSCASQWAARTSRIHCSNRHDNWELPARQRRCLLWWVFLHFNKKDLTRFTLQVCKCYTWSPWCCFLELVRIPQSILRIICMGEIKRIFLMRFKRYADISRGGLKWEAKTITIYPRMVLLADVGKNPPGPLSWWWGKLVLLTLGDYVQQMTLAACQPLSFSVIAQGLQFGRVEMSEDVNDCWLSFLLGFFWWTLCCLLSKWSQIYKPIFIIKSVP